MPVKRFAVVARTDTILKKGLKTGKGFRSFHGVSQMHISDPAEAREIEAIYGKKGTHQVNVVEDPRLSWHYNHDRWTDGYNTIHRYYSPGIDTSRVRTTKDNGWVWVWQGCKQVRMQRSVALAEGYKIVPQKRVNGQKAGGTSGKTKDKKTSQEG